jgi:hypothetical protein
MSSTSLFVFKEGEPQLLGRRRTRPPPPLEDFHIDVSQIEGPISKLPGSASQARGHRPCEGPSAPFALTSRGEDHHRLQGPDVQGREDLKALSPSMQEGARVQSGPCCKAPPAGCRMGRAGWATSVIKYVVMTRCNPP